MPRLSVRTTAALGAAAGLLGMAALVPTAHAADDDPFYSYDGSAPLSSYAPGTVLKTRTVPYHVLGIPLPVKAVQMLYRTTDAQGRPSANVTSVLKPAVGDPNKAISYQSFYDSLNPADSPSRSIAGDVTLGGTINGAETIFIAPLLLQGYTVIVSDTEGQKANFAAGPEYGTNTLDSIRASTASSATGLSSSTKVGMLGYSGGAIATSWAAALAPKYAPDVNKNLVGLAEGGLLVDPAHNLNYVSGSIGWSGIAPAAVAGIARSYDIDFQPYLNDYGKEVLGKMEKASIINVLFQYPGLTWKKLVKPQYADPASVPEYVTAVNKLNLGSAATPTIPMFIGQGALGTFEGTPNNKPGIGPGDGVMIAGDVRTLARQYCATGNSSVKYTQYNLTSHVPTAALWAPSALLYLNDRFAKKPAPSDCGRIPAGNPLTPVTPSPVE
ncbi:lipase family protein [Luteipulveratus mongoliensis]|uniref:Triacylglycerol lipase n=1 Tax=Luteipulveratus mongoliensis TaxID=571913 RepID=A0A0K1JFF6_9MICO|nr:lipase family protein [Luteipulveratus mongoliensis]AKU15436.1 triacylglycerol lipase [Luteipulveratus mongoliensis]